MPIKHLYKLVPLDLPDLILISIKVTVCPLITSGHTLAESKALQFISVCFEECTFYFHFTLKLK